MDFMSENLIDDMYGVCKLGFRIEPPLSGSKISENQSDVGEYFYYQSIYQFIFFQRWNIVRWLKVLKRGNWKEMQKMNECGYGSIIINPFENLEKFMRDLKCTYDDNENRCSTLGGFTIKKAKNSDFYYSLTYDHKYYLCFHLAPALDRETFNQLYDDFTHIELEFSDWLPR